jgi:hypothetical protein
MQVRINYFRLEQEIRCLEPTRYRFKREIRSLLIRLKHRSNDENPLSELQKEKKSAKGCNTVVYSTMILTSLFF